MFAFPTKFVELIEKIGGNDIVTIGTGIKAQHTLSNIIINGFAISRHQDGPSDYEIDIALLSDYLDMFRGTFLNDQDFIKKSDIQVENMYIFLLKNGPYQITGPSKLFIDVKTPAIGLNIIIICSQKG
jgi:hypothetical protein